MLPATGIAAHADDEGADFTGMEKAPVVESAFSENNHKSDHNVTNMQLPPPMKDNYSKVSSILSTAILPIYLNSFADNAHFDFAEHSIRG